MFKYIYEIKESKNFLSTPNYSYNNQQFGILIKNKNNKEIKGNKLN